MCGISLINRRDIQEAQINVRKLDISLFSEIRLVKVDRVNKECYINT